MGKAFLCSSSDPSAIPHVVSLFSALGVKGARVWRVVKTLEWWLTMEDSESIFYFGFLCRNVKMMMEESCVCVECDGKKVVISFLVY